MNSLEIFLIQTGIVASILILQIKSTLPCLLSSIAQMIGVKRNDKGFWPKKNISELTRSDWTDWSSTAAGNWIERKFFYLVNCGYCVNFHLCWISAIATYYITSDLLVLMATPLCFVVSAVALKNS